MYIIYRTIRNVAKAVLLGMLLSGGVAWGQSENRRVTGRVVGEDGEPLPGVTVVVGGTTSGTVTDMDGNYSIEVASAGGELTYSFIGYDSQTRVVEGDAATQIDVTLSETSQTLNEVVAVGYGTTRKGDLTGSVASVSSDDFNQGLISSAEQLINGKVPGMQIMSNSGSPSAGSTIKIRGGASLNASNDPLIVLDGVPLENGGISGNSSNFLSLINPADIESMTVLKDASSTAIYGSRASNGVIIITTKKGAKKGLHVSLSTTHSLQKATDFADMLSRDEFALTASEAGYGDLLGTATTDWNDEVFRTAYGTDNNVSLSANAGGVMPIRFSAGYYMQNGILLTDKAQRVSGNLSLFPTLLDDHLKMTLGLKGTLSKNQFASTSAIWGAATYNPTIEVHKTYESAAQFGGYNEAIAYTEAEDGSVIATPVTSAVLNPLGLLRQTDDKSDVNRMVGNFDIDYKLHPLPELRLHVTLGYDYAKGEGTVKVSPEAAANYTSNGRNYKYGPQKMWNRLLTAYINYNKTIAEMHKIDLTAGYDYQYWKTTTPQYDTRDYDGASISTVAAQDQRHAMLSYYARLNYTMKDKYMLTGTIRRDGTSRFSEDNRWGTFPSVALAWRLSEEGVLRDIEQLSNLKLRASYGVTGQQEGIGNYKYQPVYTESSEGYGYRMGDEVVSTLRPESYVSDLKWETTRAWNFGIDFGFLRNRLSGSVEYYTRETEDLLATVSVAAGTNFDKTILTNVGNVDSEGWEFSVMGTPIDNEEWTLELSANATWQQQKVKNLSLVENAAITNTLVGPSVDGHQVQVLTEGYAPYMFYVYHQLYDMTGKPIEDGYADMDGDGAITTSDMYRFHSPAPDWIMSFTASLRWRRLTIGTSLRANIGNYVYNAMAMNTGALETMKYNDYQLNNLHKSYLSTGFAGRQYYSDLYVENASFLKMDNVTLSYDFGRLADKLNLSATLMMQNVMTATKYTGVDPEVPNGVDNTFYPRPHIFSLSLGIEF